MKERNPSPIRGAPFTKGRITQQELVIYRDKRGEVKLKADMDRETIWATQAQIAEVFDIDRTVVTRHINNILKDGEIEKKSSVQKMHIANSDRPVVVYSLDIILGVGYRTNSAQAVAFRRWATKTLRDYIIKGYTLNVKRLQESRQTSVKELQKTLRFIVDTLNEWRTRMGDTLRSCAGCRCDPQGLTPCGVAPNLYSGDYTKAAT